MVKKFLIYLVLAVLVVVASIYALEAADNIMAVSVLRQAIGESQLASFNPDKNYVRAANKIDGFQVPAYHWAVRKWRRQGLLFYSSQEPLLKTIVFTRGGKRTEVVYLSSEPLGQNEAGAAFPKRGALLMATIYTGVPDDLKGVNVSQSMLIARDKARPGIDYTDLQLNDKQVDMFDGGVLIPESITVTQK